MSRYIPALSFRWLTPIYDPLIKWVMREEVIKRRLVQQANFQPHQRILDLGCGTGTLTLMVKETAVSAEVHALDGDPQVLQIARTKARQAGLSIAWVEGLTYDLPYENESFERVISSLVIHHLSTADKLRTFKESLRVLKPGAHGVVWAIPRTSHWTGTALENAGFEVRDVITHIQSQGFPKSLNVSKAIDKKKGAKRRVVAKVALTGTAKPIKGGKGHGAASTTAAIDGYEREESAEYEVTEAATPEAKKWDGWGTALKPACEFWFLVRKPFRGSVVDSVLERGTGAINVDACRVAGDVSEMYSGTGKPKSTASKHGGYGGNVGLFTNPPNETGRWPANLVLSHSHECKRVGTKRVKGSNDPRRRDGSLNGGGLFAFGVEEKAKVNVYRDAEGKETVDDWKCALGCPVRALDDQAGDRPSGSVAPGTKASGMGYGGGNGAEMQPTAGSIGGPSRFFNVFAPDPDQLVYEPFFYASKAATSEKNEGLSGKKKRKVNDGRETPIDNPYQRGETVRANTHPTVKSQALMRWLVALVTPIWGTVLDCFAGSGSTLLAAHAEEFSAIGIERESEFVEIIRARVTHATKQQRLFDAIGGTK